MKKTNCLWTTIFFIQLLCSGLYAQKTVISGTAKNSVTKDNVSSVSVTVQNGTEGTYSDDKGNIRLLVNRCLPVTLIISSVGFETRKLTVTSNVTTLDILLEPDVELGREVVVSATLLPTRILESPVSIERISAANIRNAPAATYYDVLGNLKGVDITTSSLTAPSDSSVFLSTCNKSSFAW